MFQFCEYFLFFISLIPCSLLVKYAHNLMWLMFFRKKKKIITKVRTWPTSEYLFSIQSVSEEAFLFYTCRSINIYFELFSFCVSCVNLFSYVYTCHTPFFSIPGCKQIFVIRPGVKGSCRDHLLPELTAEIPESSSTRLTY